MAEEEAARKVQEVAQRASDDRDAQIRAKKEAILKMAKMVEEKRSAAKSKPTPTPTPLSEANLQSKDDQEAEENGGYFIDKGPKTEFNRGAGDNTRTVIPAMLPPNVIEELLKQYGPPVREAKPSPKEDKIGRAHV